MLDRVYRALGDATRRRLLAQLDAGAARITDLAAPLPMSFAAVARHVSVLERAGLIERHVRGREHWLTVRAGALTDAEALDRAADRVLGPARRRPGRAPGREARVTADDLATARVERVLDASPAEAYAAWVDPAVLARFIAPQGTAAVELDPRVGGRLRIVMTFPDRNTEIEGEFLVLDRPHRISFSWRPLRAAFDSVVTVALEPDRAARA